MMKMVATHIAGNRMNASCWRREQDPIGGRMGTSRACHWYAQLRRSSCGSSSL